MNKSILVESPAGKRINTYECKPPPEVSGTPLVSEEGIFWYVIMDMSTGEVLWQKRLIAKPGGFGLRNYWIEPLFKIMKQIRKEKYENWALEYGVRI